MMRGIAQIAALGIAVATVRAGEASGSTVNPPSLRVSQRVVFRAGALSCRRIVVCASHGVVRIGDGILVR